MLEELLKLIDELQKSNVLWGKKWVACGDSFTEGAFQGIEGEDTTFSEGLYAGEKKVYPFFIGRRNHSNVSFERDI